MSISTHSLPLMHCKLILGRTIELVISGVFLLPQPLLAAETTIKVERNSRQPLPAEVTDIQLLTTNAGNCIRGQSWDHDRSRQEIWTGNCAAHFQLRTAATAPAEQDGSSAGEVITAVAALAALAGIAAIVSRNDQDEDRWEPPSGARPADRYPPSAAYYPDRHQPPAYQDRNGAIRGPKGLCLGMSNRGNGVAKGAEAVLERCDGRRDQRFQWSERGEIQVGGLCLDANGGGTRNGTKIIAWKCSGGKNQKWFVDGPRIRGEQSGRCFDVQGNRLQPGTPVILYDCHSGSNQRWSY